MSKNKYAPNSYPELEGAVNETPVDETAVEISEPVEAVAEPVANSNVGNAATAADLITLNNATRIPVVVHSVTGDSILLPVGSHTVPGHFNWNLPDGVTIVSG